MKIEQLIVQKLYQSKKVTLQDIGTFILSGDTVLPPDSDKDVMIPENAVSFEFNKKAVQDDELVDFIVSHTRKIKPLAASDLESYSILAKQFLNIGKPFPIEGLGVLQKTQEGDYKFISGHFSNAKLETPAQHREKAEEEISFAAPARETASKKWLWILLLLVVAAIAATLYYFLKSGDKEKQAVQEVANTDTVAKPKDTVLKPIVITPDTLVAPVDTLRANGYTFRVVIREFSNKGAAEKFNSKFTGWGYKFTLYTKDSVTYKIAIPFTGPLSDTLRAKDSLRALYKTNAYIDM